MIISLIVAISENNVIGKDNALIWHLPADMAYFKSKTIGHHVLMGRKNFESIPAKYKPLPDRMNIVVSRQIFKNSPSLIFVHDIRSGIELAEQNGESELFIIGGGEIYRQSMALADKLYVTEVHSEFDGDTYFPKIDGNLWQEISREFRKSDDKNKYDISYVEYLKK